MLDVILEATDETVDEEILWKVSLTTLHECHPLFIGIDVIVHSGELFQLLELFHRISRLAVREPVDQDLA
jgi:hypothetical protein